MYMSCVSITVQQFDPNLVSCTYTHPHIHTHTHTCGVHTGVHTSLRKCAYIDTHIFGVYLSSVIYWDINECSLQYRLLVSSSVQFCFCVGHTHTVKCVVVTHLKHVRPTLLLYTLETKHKVPSLKNGIQIHHI